MNLAAAVTPPPLRGWARTWRWSWLLVVFAGLSAYHNSLEGPFVFDDASSIVTNPTIRRLWPLTEPLTPPKTNVTAQGRPILNLSLAINYACGGTSPRGYHVLNLLIHIGAGLVLMGILRRTLLLPYWRGRFTENAALGLATAGAVLWTVHPLQTESVTYIIQRAESLMGLFYLLTLYLFIRATESERVSAGRDGTSTDRRQVSFAAGAIAACAAGMATKEVMATAPLMVLSFDRTFLAGSFRGALRRRPWVYGGLFATWLLLAALVVQTGGNRGGSVGFGVGIAWWDYWLTQFRALTHYGRLIVWPASLVFEYGSFWIGSLGEVWAEAVFVIALVAASAIGLWRRKPLGFAGAWFFGVLAPTSLAPGTTQMIVEHRVYLSLAAAVAVAVIGLHVVGGPRGRRAAGWIWGLAALACVAATVRRNHDYRSEVALWSDTIEKRPANPLAHFLLAGAWERAGDPARAAQRYAEALRLKPDFSVGHENYGELLLRTGRRTEAIAHFENALALQPELADAHMNLGNAFVLEGRNDDAVRHLAEAVRLQPDVAEARYNLAHALVRAGQTNGAMREFAAALARPAGNPAVHLAAHLRLANLLALSGRPGEAVPHYEAALRSRPDDPEVHHNLAGALSELGRRDEAMRHYEETLRLAPDFPGAREHLARLRAAR